MTEKELVEFNIWRNTLRTFGILNVQIDIHNDTNQDEEPVKIVLLTTNSFDYHKLFYNFTSRTANAMATATKYRFVTIAHKIQIFTDAVKFSVVNNKVSYSIDISMLKGYNLDLIERLVVAYGEELDSLIKQVSLLFIKLYGDDL